MFQASVIAFYKFVELPDFTEKRQPLLDFCNEQKIKGSILLAREGINGMIAGSSEGVRAVVSFLQSDPRLGELECKESSCAEPPFRRMKVRLKKEIVTLGIAEVDPAVRVGRYVKPQQWNALIVDPEVIVIDARNRYEVEMGTFEGARNPNTESFREFPEYVRANLDPLRHTKVALFCTGGIRCEKATSYMLSRGFNEVYHLEGGILKYLEEIPVEESLWRGKCFVFDERVAVTHELQPACPSALDESKKLEAIS